MTPDLLARPASDRSTIRTNWSNPRTWRSHPLATEQYWVETEVEVVIDGAVVDHLSWPDPLGDDERASYEQALRLKWQILG